MRLALRRILFALADSVAGRSYFRGRDRLTTALLATGQSVGGTPLRVIIDGLEFEVDLRDNHSQGIWFAGQLPTEAKLLEDLCGDGDTVIDVGANIGYTSLAAHRAVGPSGAVVALEPGSRAYALLNRNTEHASGISAIRAAVGSVEGLAELVVAEESSDYSSLRGNVVPGRTHTERVPLRTLKSLCRELHLWPTVVKVDVEGAEWDVLRGLLDVHRPRILLVEACAKNTRAFGYEPSAMFAWLGSRGYELTVVTDDGERPYTAHLVDRRLAKSDVVARIAS
jgi:FkbM family methyltransferase